MKRIKLLLIAIISIIVIPLKANASSISNIKMDIYIDDNGTAHVTEIWSANITEGTEGYKPYYNLGNSTITNFTVTENGKTYKQTSPWEIDGSLKDKAYKNGIHQITNGIELCWGISSYGKHNYELKYDIENFIVSTTDADMIYFQLIPNELSTEPKNINIRIYGDERYSNNLDVWGYGNHNGTAYVYNGIIEMNSEGILESHEYMTLLAKFPKGTYKTNNTVPNDFAYYYEMAEEGKENYGAAESDNAAIIIAIIFGIVPLTIASFFAYIYARLHKGLKPVTIGNKKYYLLKEDKKLPSAIPNYRDIPFNKDIFKAYWVAECYKLNSKQEDFLGAILLKWLLENKIALKKEKAKTLSKKEETIIDMSKEVTFDTELEKELYDMMKTASKDNFLESKEFEKYCSKNYSKIFNWFNKVLNKETDKLKQAGKVTTEKRTFLKAFKEKVSILNSSVKEDAIKLKGLKNFLEDFSRIDDKEAIEVKLWEHYLIYAQILGIADKVEKQFKKLYPELLETDLSGYTYGDLIFIRSMCVGATTSLTTARANSYTAGGGGYSSGGGGMGAFGGGGGGGGFR